MTVAATTILERRVETMTKGRAGDDASANSQSAFERMFRAHHHEITAYVHRRIGDRHIAEDIVADVFLSALLAWPKFRDRGRGSRPWLYRIATNAVSDALRRRRVRRELLTVEAHIEAVVDDEDASRAERVKEVRRALLRLPLKQQTVLSLHYLQELSVRDIAAILSCRVGTVKSRLARARRALEIELIRREHHHGAG